MGNESNIEEDNNKYHLNEDEIIENDCYEEINLKKRNKIIQDEKQWNKNSIIYTMKDKEFLNIEEEIKENENQNNSEKEKSDEHFFKHVTMKKPIKDNSEKEKEKEIPLNQEGNNTNNNNNNNNNYNNDIPKTKDYSEKNEKNENQNNIEIKEDKENKDNKDTKGDIKTNDVEKERSDISKNNNKAKLKPTNTGNGITEKNKRRSKKNINNPDIIHNNSTNTKLNNNTNNNNDNHTEYIIHKNINDFLDIKNIIPEYRLNHLKDDEIIYSGTLEKILKIPEKNKIAYSQRFCILTKNYFAYYKSKESYISLNKPLLLLNNNNIIRIENTSFIDNTYYFGIICEVNDETKKFIDKVNSFVTKEDDITELLLGFRTKQFEDMIKWVVVLTYFTSGQNKGK